MTPNKLIQLLRDNAQPGARASGTCSIRCEAGDPGGDAHLYVYDVIDAWWGVSAAGLVEALQSVAPGSTVHLHINSPGGDVFEAQAMASAIVAYPGRVVSHIDGLAASAATYLALAANEVRMTDGGLFMVHNSWTIAMGNADDLESTSALLRKIDGELVNRYAKRTGQDATQVKEWLDAETWFTATEAMDAGFVNAIDPAAKDANEGGAQARVAGWNLSAYANAPAPKAIEQEPEDDSALVAECVARHQASRNRLRLVASNLRAPRADAARAA